MAKEYVTIRVSCIVIRIPIFKVNYLIYYIFCNHQLRINSIFVSQAAVEHFVAFAWFARIPTA